MQRQSCVGAEASRGMADKRGVSILHVAHASKVAAISSATGPARLLNLGMRAALASGDLDVEVTEIRAPDGGVGEVADSFAVASRISEAVRDARDSDRRVVVLSSSCHTAIGSVAGMIGPERGVIWLDAHADFNTPETSGSGLLDLMTLASLTGRCWRTMCAGVPGFDPVSGSNTVLVGARDLDGDEAAMLAESGVVTVSASEALGLGAEAISALGKRTSSVYVHVDLDVLDSSEWKANAFATPGGITAEALVELVKRSCATCSVEVVAFTSYDPAFDEGDAVGQAALEVAMVIAESSER